MMRAQRLAAVALLLVACGGSAQREKEGPTDSPSPQGTAGSGGSSSTGGTAGTPTSCELPPPTLVRLTFDEIIASARVLLGDELADEMAAAREGASAFPPLASPTEGPVLNRTTFFASDELAEMAGKHARERFDLTACDSDDFACVRDYVATLGERAFRRPLTEREQLALLEPINQAEALGADATIGLEYGVQAVFSSPHFLYRSALGEQPAGSANRVRRLTDYELASALSFFFTGAPPDDTLLSAARTGALSSDEHLEAQVARLLDIPASRKHFERLLTSYFDFDRLERVIILDAQLTDKLRATMRTELDALLATELWSGGVGNLLTSPRARVDASLAEVYGIAFPPAGARPDADGFVALELPPTRAGLLMRAGWEAMHSRPDATSVIGRGMGVRRLLCPPSQTPPDIVPTPEPADVVDASEQERAAYRMTTPVCKDCHLEIDPLGLALEDLDRIGRFRTTDRAGRPIDASATLPPFAGGATVSGALELSHALPEDRVALCLSRSFIAYARGNVDTTESCEEQTFAQARAEAGDQSFTQIIRQIALSPAFRLRRE